MTCSQCDSELICRLKDYGGNFPPSLQWQNYNGTAHYKTTDGKNFSCNVPNEEETAQTRIPSETATTPGTPPPSPTLATSSSNLAILNAIEDTNRKLLSMDEMIQAIFRYTVDEQLKKK